MSENIFLMFGPILFFLLSDLVSLYVIDAVHSFL